MKKPTLGNCWVSDVTMRRLILILALLISGVCQAESTDVVSQPTSTSEPYLMMPFNIVRAPEKEAFEISYMSHNGSMIVNGKINGIPVRFVVDTGASLVSISPAIAKQAGISTATERSVRLQTANGIVNAPLIEIDQVIADRISITHVAGVVQQVSDDPNLCLLGMSFFGKHKLTIDHSRNTIVLEPK